MNTQTKDQASRDKVLRDLERLEDYWRDFTKSQRVQGGRRVKPAPTLSQLDDDPSDYGR